MIYEFIDCINDSARMRLSEEKSEALLKSRWTIFKKFMEKVSYFYDNFLTFFYDLTFNPSVTVG
jgi:hypothetical protein